MKSLNEVIRDTKIAITEVVSDGKKTWTCKNEKGESISGELGYKVFTPNWTCRGGFQYEVGKSFVENLKPCLCTRGGATQGMHYCVQAADCFNYYSFNSDNKVALVLAYGDVDGNVNENKRCTNKLFIIREIPWCELLELVNAGKDNTGRCNTGDCNTGHCNTGDCNTGHYNTGSRNTGHYNTGYYNTGNYNTGHCNTGGYNAGGWNAGNHNTGSRNTGNHNTGHCNTGYCNTGDSNTGGWNTGDCNTGDCNTGDCNTGHYNTGLRNTGDWNTGNYNTGFFNTNEPFVRSFNKPTNMYMAEFYNLEGVRALARNYSGGQWVCAGEMSDEEKVAHPEHVTTGGYLKVLPFREACHIMWGHMSEKEREAVHAIPNFDATLFKEITGIDA